MSVCQQMWAAMITIHINVEKMCIRADWVIFIIFLVRKWNLYSVIIRRTALLYCIIKFQEWKKIIFLIKQPECDNNGYFTLSRFREVPISFGVIWVGKGKKWDVLLLSSHYYLTQNCTFHPRPTMLTWGLSVTFFDYGPILLYTVTWDRFQWEFLEGRGCCCIPIRVTIIFLQNYVFYREKIMECQRHMCTPCDRGCMHMCGWFLFGHAPTSSFLSACFIGNKPAYSLCKQPNQLSLCSSTALSPSRKGSMRWGWAWQYSDYKERQEPG